VAMNTHELLTKHPLQFVFGALAVAALILTFGPLFTVLLALFLFLLYHTIRLFKELFSKNNPKKKLLKMLAGKMVFDNNVWMDKKYDLLFENIMYLCKKSSSKVILFQIQIEEIANIRNKAKDPASDEYKMAELAIKRIENFQKSKVLKIEDKKAKEPAPKPQDESGVEEAPLEPQKEIIVKIEQTPPAPKKPALPADPKEAIHKSLLIDSLTTRLGAQKEYTYVSVNPELRVRLRAFLMENSDKQADIVEAKKIEGYCKYVDRWRSKLLESFQKKKVVKGTKAVFANGPKMAYSVHQKLKEAGKL
jgi:hypothetical protein